MKRKNQGFTLVEILIVVVILGILAAIVIPQFSDASTQSKISSAASSIQTMRSQISLYKIQHNDAAPGQTAANFESDMTVSDGTYGPYLQTVPKNPFGCDATQDGTAASYGWVYDLSNGSIWLDPTNVGDSLTELQDKGVCDPDYTSGS